MYGFLKRTFDIVCSLLALIVLSPIMIITALAVVLTSSGPALFMQTRVGKDKRLFLMFKFRSMRTDVDSNVPTHLLEHPEQYITPVGRFIRKTSIDELPQLINILMGQMSFVGPRPALPNQHDLIAERDKYGANSVKPGLTGWAQINGRDELPISTKAAFDGEYVKKRSFLFDLKCIFLTFSKVIRGDGIAEGKDAMRQEDLEHSAAENWGITTFKDKLRIFLHNLKRIQFIYIIGDIILGAASMYISIWLRFEGHIQERYLEHMGFYLLVAALTIVISGIFTGSYSGMWEYWGLSDTLRQLSCAGISAAIFLIIKYSGILSAIYPDLRISGSITVMYFGVVFVLTTAMRMLPSFGQWLMVERSSKQTKRAIIIGAGTTGAMLVKMLRENVDNDIYPVAIVDRDVSKIHMRLAGVVVAGGADDIPQLAKKYRATDAILAVPHIDPQDMTAIYHKCTEAGLNLRVFRDTVDVDSFLVGDQKALREVSIEDLLFRDSVTPNMSGVFDFLEGKTVLVTGGAGSIGSEICRQVLEHGCRRLIIFDFNENGLFTIDQNLKQDFDPRLYELVLGSVRDKQRLEHTFEKFAPELVLHAAAHKHVPMMEINTVEAIKNNIFGTKNVLDCCCKYDVKRFILISTDKAVKPTNIMGATKRMAELLVQSVEAETRCSFAAVRFGNVLGSNGSVIPTFRKQIAAGGPVTVTHKDIVRYFMTIPEAVSLVLIAGTMCKGGEVFLLDMGRPVRIYDLAVDLIRLSGFEPEKDIQIKITGLRPGEKLYEELVQGEEKVVPTTHKKIFTAVGSEPDKDRIEHYIELIEKELKKGENEVQLRKLVFEAIQVDPQEVLQRSAVEAGVVEADEISEAETN